jgi:NADPH:quinone reductase
MRAVQISTTGSAEVLAVVDVPIPVPGLGEALIQIDSAGVNFIDIYQREGRYPTRLPLVLGQEGAGTIVQIGPGDTTFKGGDRVVWRGGFGAYAEFALVPMERLLAIPNGITLEQAAASITQGLTAHYLTHSVYPIQPDDIVLIHAGRRDRSSYDPDGYDSRSASHNHGIHRADGITRAWCRSRRDHSVHKGEFLR